MADEDGNNRIGGGVQTKVDGIGVQTADHKQAHDWKDKRKRQGSHSVHSKENATLPSEKIKFLFHIPSLRLLPFLMKFFIRVF
ncbi:hypothetical protein VIBNISO65_790012 [Vibrio nigripulchritudo SO65]|nr:hypothetical protein VIBNIAM115_1860012 [Vibrio nigripulchritudo AM115]CCN78943.1 hypothetical protein VIBNISO65_790012 [Vibrio nigripulchritudo SO65]